MEMHAVSGSIRRSAPSERLRTGLMRNSEPIAVLQWDEIRSRYLLQCNCFGAECIDRVLDVV